MNVRSLSLQISRGGMTDGILSFCVGLSKDSPAYSAASLIDKIVSHKAGFAKYVLISGDLAAEDGEVMNAFCKALKDFGYHVIVETNGTFYPVWFQHIEGIRVILKPDSVWVRHAASEINLYITSGTDPEPPLPPNQCPMYVIADDIRQAVLFTKEATHPWGIIEKHRKPLYSEIIYAGVQDSGIALRIGNEKTRS
jgi:hypothetical protein